MKQKLAEFFNLKNVLILGYGREGKSTFNLIKDLNCKVTVADKNPISDSELDGYPLITGNNYLENLAEFDIIMKSPGIILLDNVSKDVKNKITSQTDLLLRFCSNTIVGITGTKGKSTTSSLIYHILTKCGKSAVLIGNIGIPPLECIDMVQDDTIIVCEMSCHQLEYVSASPKIAVLLNIYEEHLDHYVDFAAYRATKENIYKFQTQDDVLFYNIECKNEYVDASPCKKMSLSYDNKGDIYVTDRVYINGSTVNIPTTCLKGQHNLYNIAVAIAVCVELGCDINMANDMVESFKGLPHRLEQFAVVNGVRYVNDSISTIPKATIAALTAFPEADTVIIGGMDRGISYDLLINYLNSLECKDKFNVILLKNSGYRIYDFLSASLNRYRASDLADAVSYAKKVTKKCCILSPAAASYGFYKNFEERGDEFKRLVTNLAT